jgi:hypothetical protein
MFEPSPGVFQNMQALLAAKRPESALKLKDEFGRCGLPLTGFDHPYEPTPSHLDGSGIGRQHDLDHTATHDKRAAMPLFYLIVSTFGLIALACIGGGIYAIHRSSYASTKFDFLGVHLESGSVGVALVVVGVVVAFFTVKAVLKKV